PNMDAVLKRYVVNSDGVRARLGAPKTVAYGASAIETLDIYPTGQSQRSRPGVRSRWRLADGEGQGLRVCGRSVRASRRSLRRARFRHRDEIGRASCRERV